MPFLLIPFLGTLATTIFTTIFVYLASKVAKRAALTLAALVFLLGIWVAFIAVLLVAIKSLVFVSPPDLGHAISIFMPNSLYPCVSAIFTCHMAGLVFDMKNKIYQTIFGRSKYY